MNQYVRLRPVLILLLAAVACVTGLAWVMDARGAESASPTASAAASPAADAGKVVYKVGWTRQPDNLNPFIGFESPAFEMWYLTYDSLVGYDPKTLSPMKGENSTGLATDWSVSGDGLTWTFKIRHNAKWDDGVPLTAKDVAFTYNYIVDNPDYTSNLTAYTNLIKQGHRARRLHGAVRVLQAEAGHDAPLGAHPARARLVQDRPEVAEGVHEQPALRGLRPVQVRRVEEEQLRPSRRQPHLVGPQAHDHRPLLHVLHQRRHHAAGHQGRHRRRRREPGPDPGQAAAE